MSGGSGRHKVGTRGNFAAILSRHPFDAFRQDYVRFLGQRAGDYFEAHANEMAHFATHADIESMRRGMTPAQGWSISRLKTSPSSYPGRSCAGSNSNATLLTPLQHLLHYARMKWAISSSDESLLKILEDPITAALPPATPLFTLTRWDQTSLDDLLALFGGDPAGLSHLELFHRVYEAFELTQKMGISARALIAATTNGPTGDTIQDLRAALRARYDAADWRSVVQPSTIQCARWRHALVTHSELWDAIQPRAYDTADKLFEYFWMDADGTMYANFAHTPRALLGATPIERHP